MSAEAASGRKDRRRPRDRGREEAKEKTWDDDDGDLNGESFFGYPLYARLDLLLLLLFLPSSFCLLLVFSYFFADMTISPHHFFSQNPKACRIAGRSRRLKRLDKETKVAK